MKKILLALTLPCVLTGCAAYVGDYGPGYPGAYDGYDYGGPTYIGYASYNRGYYQHGYHHYDTAASHSSVAFHGSSHGGAHSFANVSHAGGGHVGASSHGTPASASMGAVGGGHR